MRLAWCIVVLVAAGLASAAAEEPSASSLEWAVLRELESTRKWAAVESLAIEFVARLEAQASPDSSELARALLHRAQAAWEQRRHGEPGVTEALERSISLQSRHDAPGGQRRPWSHLLAARLLHDLAKAEPALGHARAASALLASIDRPDTILWADAELYVGLANVALARPVEARAGYARSLVLREAKYGAQSPNLVPALAEYAMMLTDQGEFEEARALLVRAETLAERMETPFNNFLMETLARRSTLEARAGHLAESIELAERASAGILERWGAQSVEYARARVRLAYRLEDFGDHAGEARILQESVPVLDEALGAEHPHTINARVAWLTASLETGDTATVARELPVIRRALLAQAGTVNRNALYGALFESKLAHLRGDVRTARAKALEALALDVVRDDASGRSPAVTIAALLRTCTSADDRPTVERFGAELDRLAVRTSVDGTKEWIEVAVLRAHAEARVGLHDRAWQTAHAADDLARAWFRYEVQALPDERALQLASRIGEASEILVALAESTDQVELAWDRLVQWRGLVAQEIARRRPASIEDEEGAVVAAHAEWRDAQRHFARQMVAGSMRPSDPAAIAALDSAKALAEAAERRYVRAARGGVEESTSISLADVRARLRPDQVLVGFARGDDGGSSPALHAFLAHGSGSELQRIRLGSVEEIEAAIVAWREALKSVLRGEDTHTSEARARALGTVVRSLVWDRVAARIGDARDVAIVAEAPLTELPWLALPSGDDRYLAEESIGLRVLNAERELLRPRSVREGSGLLAIGDPDFDADSRPAPAREPYQLALRSAASPCLETDAIVLEDLPASRAEVEQITTTWSLANGAGAAETMVGMHANERDVKERAPGRAVVHLATHGILVQDGCAHTASLAGTRGVGGITPLDDPAPTVSGSARRVQASPWLGRRVWLALAGANHARRTTADENEGMLTAEEIVTLDLRGTDWVVLSACDSGVGEAWTREGLLGLRRAFHLAGARAVIASQWPVADDATRAWMSALYRARAVDSTAGAAVQAACRDVLAARRAEGKSTHPFFWAAFAATGD